MRRSLLSLSVLPLVSLVGSGCSDGGGKEIPEGQVQVSQSHYVWGFNSPTFFREFPLEPTEIAPVWGTFTMGSASDYQIVLNGTGGNDTYALEDSGDLSVFISPGERSARILFQGAYGLGGNNGTYLFTDRFTSNSSNNIGVFWGTKIISDPADVEGGWHVFTQHVIFDEALRVGQTLAGSLDIDAAGDITGMGAESGRATITLGGKANSFGDSRIDLTLEYTDSLTTDTRIFICGAGERFAYQPPTPPPPPPPPPPPGGLVPAVSPFGTYDPTGTPAAPSQPAIRQTPGVILGLDADDSDGEAGLIAMVAKRIDPADKTKLVGQYLVGLHTIFVDLVNAGTDSAFGTLTFDDTDAFELVGRGSGGVAFTYTGSYVLEDDGKLTLTVSATNETWVGAVDQSYQVVTIADNVIESRSGNKPPELNLFVAIRQVEPPP